MNDVTLQEAVTLFLGGYSNPATVKAYKASLGDMVAYIKGKRLLADVSPALVAEYFNTVVSRETYATATKVKCAKTIKTFWNYCVRMGWVEQSPARAFHTPKLPRRISRDKAMKDDELAAVLEEVQGKPRDLALILFLATTGCRRGGAVGLREPHLDLDQRCATITEKGEKERTVWFSQECADALRRWFAYRKKHYQLQGDYVFSRHGEAMKVENISLIIRRACKAAGVRVMSSHSLRHRVGHKLADARIAPSIAATALGHDSVEVTMKYYSPGDLETAEKVMREIMGDTAPPPSTPDAQPDTKPDTGAAKPAKIIRFPGGKTG